MTVVSRTTDNATLRIELIDARTGAPIRLGRDRDLFPVAPQGTRGGYITVAGKRVRTNASGVAMVEVNEPGVYTARYVPGSWLTTDPAYTGATATARWHPLVTLAGWLRLFGRAIQWFLPLAVAVYAGHRIGQLARIGGVDR